MTEGVVDSQTAEIGVVICTYDNAPVLDLALHCLARQTLSASVKWSVLVVDNNSTDETAQIVHSHIRAGIIPNLTITQEKRQGLTHARIRGISETRSPWIAFVDDDNLLEPDWIEEAARFIALHPSADMLGGRIELEWEVPPPPLVLEHRDGFVFRDYGPEPIRLPAAGCRLPVGAGLLLRREAVISCGWLERHVLGGRTGSQLTSGEDTELAVRLLKAHGEIWYVPDLRLRHFISKRRIDVGYVCRLYRGFAESNTILEAIQQPARPGIAWRMKMFIRGLSYLTRRTAAWIAWDVVAGRRLRTKRLVQVYEGMGYVHGAWRFLFFGFGRGESNE